MFPVSSGRRLLVLAALVLAAAFFALPAAAQTTGIVKGKVVDQAGKAVQDAKVTIEFKEGINRVVTTKTDKKGEFVQIGLAPGQYTVTVEKEKVGAQAQDVRVRLGDAAEMKFTLAPGSSVANKEEQAKLAQLQTAFNAGVAASQAGDQDGAIAKFQEAIGLHPGCYECYANIGQAYFQKKQYDEAATAFNKAIELKADYGPAYSGLATVYNMQKKFTEAEQASQKAAELSAASATEGGGGSANDLYNLGVIAWNAQKVDDAKAKFEAALKVDPNHAESHYQLGMCLVNLAKYAEAAQEFETYVKLSPNGPNAAQAQVMITACKAQIK